MANGKPKGIARFRRLLRRLPGVVRGEIVAELYVTGRQMVQAVLAKTPNRRGALRSGIKSKVLPTSLRLQIGLIGSKAERAGLFYGRIQDLGRRAQIVSVRRYRRGARSLDVDRFKLGRGGGKSAKLTTTYQMRVRGMAPKRFITGRYPDLRQTLNQNLRGIFARSLTKIGNGE